MTTRRPLHTIGTAGAANGDVPTYDAAADRLVYTAPPTGGSGGPVTQGTTLPDPATVPDSMFVLLPAVSSYANTVLAKSPLAYYRLNEASGTTLADTSGNNRNGVYEGSPTLGSASLVSGGDTAVAFAGGQRGKVTGATWMAGAPLTMEAWIKPTAAAIGVYGAIVNNNDVPSGAFLRLNNSGKFDFVVASTTVTSGIAAVAGTVYHVVGVWDGSTIYLYVNGALASSTPKSGSITPGTLCIGDNGAGSNYFKGTIDEVAIYGAAHTAAEVQNRYNVGIGSSAGATPIGAQLYYSDGNTWSLLGAKKIDSLVDVDTATVAPTDKALLRFDAAAQQWKPVSGGLAPAGGASGQMLVKASSADFDLTYATPSSGGGTGGSSPWSPVVAANAMASLTGWLAKDGTWTLGTYGVQQTDTTKSNAYLEWATNVPLSAVAMKATIRFPGSTPTWCAGFQLFADDAVVGAPAVSVWLRRDGFIQWDRYGSGGGTFNTGLTLTTDTDYVFAVIKRGTMIDCYVNNLHVVTITTDTAISWSRRRVGLESRNGQAWFRDVSIWVPTTPW